MKQSWRKPRRRRRPRRSRRLSDGPGGLEKSPLPLCDHLHKQLPVRTWMSSTVASSLAADATRASTSRPLDGISIAGFDAVIAAAGGRAALDGVTTGALKYAHVLPTTAAAAVAYSDELRARPNGADLVGAATQFLSHAYDYAFLDAVDAAAAWERRNPRADGSSHFFYFDLFVVNQHGQNTIVPFEVLRNEFGGGVRSVGSTLFMLDYAAPLSLSRAWCVFEAAMTLACGARFEVVMVPRSEAAFAQALVDDFDSLLTKTCAVDVETATAREPGDEANIKRAVREVMGGFDAVNKIVIGSMRTWMAGAGRTALRAMPDDRAVGELQSKLARLLMCDGEYDEAEELMREALQARRASGHCSTLQAATNLAQLLLVRGKLGEAEPLCREALTGFLCTEGETHRDTLTAMNDLATLLQKRGLYDEAEPLFRTVLDRRREGALDAELLAATNNLAFLLQQSGKIDEALSLFRDCVAGFRSLLGASHPNTLSATNKTALLLYNAQFPDEARPLFNEVLSVRRKVLGDKHPDTLVSVANLADFMFSTGEVADAEALFREALEGRRAVFGDKNPTTLLSFGWLVHLLRSQSRWDEAAPLARDALVASQEVHGDAHTSTLNAMGALAAILRGSGQLAEVEPLLRKVLVGRRALLGDAHAHTLLAARNLTIFLREQGREDEALAILPRSPDKPPL